MAMATQRTKWPTTMPSPSDAPVPSHAITPVNGRPIKGKQSHSPVHHTGLPAINPERPATKSYFQIRRGEARPSLHIAHQKSV
ncbi:hypothetical protein SUGI_1066890 [Cryptomeria japonica]|nr:hypothetical protein SUGI_1066890 [Cryptomeria japonica]